MALRANRLISIIGVAIALGAAVLMIGRDQIFKAPAQDAAPSEFSRFAEPEGDRQDIVAGLFQGALLNAADGADFGSGPAYMRLLQHVQAIPSADFSSRVAGRLNWEAAMANPAQWRGEFVRVRGLCGRMDAVKLRGAGADLADVYRGFVGQPDGKSELVAFDCVVPPGEITANKDVLDLEGVFYRTVRYESKEMGMVEVPYLIVRNLSVYQPPVTHMSAASLLIRVGLVAAAAIAVALLMLRLTSRRRPPVTTAAQPGFREMLESRVREDQLKPKRP